MYRAVLFGIFSDKELAIFDDFQIQVPALLSKLRLLIKKLINHWNYDFVPLNFKTSAIVLCF